MVDMTERIRVSTRISQEMHDDLDDLREHLGLNKSAIVGLCVSVGITYLKAMTNPESLITSKKMAEVMLETEKLERLREELNDDGD